MPIGASFAKTALPAAFLLAAGLAVGGQPAKAMDAFEWADGTDGFISEVVPGSDFDVIFSPGGIAAASTAEGVFAGIAPNPPNITTPTLIDVTPALGDFDWVAGNTWELGSDLVFDFFNEDFTATLPAGTLFGFISGPVGLVQFSPMSSQQWAVAFDNDSSANFTASSSNFQFALIAGSDAGVYTVSVANDPPAQVPGPLPLMGAGVAFGYSRKLRRRIKSSVSA